MDSLINAAARALAQGNPLRALKFVALREDAAGLALRGIALAQIGDLRRARGLLQRASRAFEPREAIARARCIAAQAEIALAARDLRWIPANLPKARATLAAGEDNVNVAHADSIEARRLLLLGELDAAARILERIPDSSPAALSITRDLLHSGIAMRRTRAAEARRLLERARRSARHAGIPALNAEVDQALAVLDAPVARLGSGDEARALTLADVESLEASTRFIVDGARLAVFREGVVVPLARRPVLFALILALAQAWPGEATRESLVKSAFRRRSVDDSLRARLRVEIGRLRTLLRSLARIEATPRGYALLPAAGREVVVLASSGGVDHAQVLALLGDGESWSSAALAMASGRSQRAIQRSLTALAHAGKVQCHGHGRARRWTSAPLAGFTTRLLLPALPGSR